MNHVNFSQNVFHQGSASMFGRPCFQLVTAALYSVLGLGLLIAQTTRSVSRGGMLPSEPVQAPSLSVNGAELIFAPGMNPAVTFEDTKPRWLDDVSFLLVNNSSQPVTAVEVMAYVPAWEVGNAHAQTIVRFHDGHLPEHALHTTDGHVSLEDSPQELSISAGKSALISLARLGVILSEQFSLHPSFSEIHIQIDRIFFADGTAWAHGTYLRPNTAKPGSYVRMPSPQH